MYISLFLFNRDNLYANSMILLIYESGTYGLNLSKIVQMCEEKVIARHDPHRNPELGGGSSPPQHSQKWATMLSKTLLDVMRFINPRSHRLFAGNCLIPVALVL